MIERLIANPCHALRLGRKEGVEEMLETLGGEPDARILHRHDHAI